MKNVFGNKGQNGRFFAAEGEDPVDGFFVFAPDQRDPERSPLQLLFEVVFRREERFGKIQIVHVARPPGALGAGERAPRAFAANANHAFTRRNVPAPTSKTGTAFAVPVLLKATNILDRIAKKPRFRCFSEKRANNSDRANEQFRSYIGLQA